MTRVFDGMAGVFSGLFGAPVIVTPTGGADPTPQAVQGIVRNREIEVAAEDGEAVITRAWTLRLPASAVAEALVEGDAVTCDQGSFRVRYALPVESPAADAFVTFVLGKDS